MATGCVDISAALTKLADARHLAAEMHVEFVRSSAASNRAVLADTDEASAAAAADARQARQVVDRNLESLRQTLASLGYADDARQLEAFRVRYEDYRRLDDEIVPLAVENINLKAPRQSVGPSREAADAFRAARITVRSLAMSLERKRTATAECDEQLRLLEQSLAGHVSAATR